MTASGGDPRVARIVYAVAAVVLEIAAGIIQGITAPLELIGVAALPFVFGFIAAAIRRLFRRATNVPKWAFWWAVVVLLLELLDKYSN